MRCTTTLMTVGTCQRLRPRKLFLSLIIMTCYLQVCHGRPYFMALKCVLHSFAFADSFSESFDHYKPQSVGAPFRPPSPRADTCLADESVSFMSARSRLDESLMFFEQGASLLFSFYHFHGFTCVTEIFEIRSYYTKRLTCSFAIVSV